MRHALLRCVLPLVAAALCAGCGHPASPKECEEIFDKSAEIELKGQNIQDPAVIAKRTAEARAARGDELIQRCVGRRITDNALSCVRAATTPEQIDRCLE